MMCSTGHGESGPGARAQDHSKDHVMTDAGAVDGLRDGKAIGVIGDPNFSLQRLAEVRFNWLSVEPGGTRAFGYSGTRVH